MNYMERAFLNASKQLTKQTGEEVIIGTWKGTAFVGDQDKAISYDNEGGAHDIVRLQVIIPNSADMSAEMGRMAVVRGKEWFIESIAWDGGENTATLMHDSES